MKILIVTTEIGLNGGGLSLSCAKLKDILEKEHEVCVLDSSLYPINTAKGGFFKDIEISIKKEYKLKTDISIYADFDVVIGFGGKYNGYYASILAEKLNAQFILSLRGSDINLAKWNIEDCWYLTEAIKRAGKIVCLSNEMAKNTLSLCPSSYEKIQIIQNPLYGTVKPISFPNLPNAIKIGCAAAHLNEKKGIANLLKMVWEFKKISNKTITLELVGEIDEDLKQNYIQIIKALNISNDIVFVNKKDRHELSRIMSTWDFYVQGSVCEGHPNSITECLQIGTGFISTKTGFIAELLCDKYNELFFDTWEPYDMACTLKSLSEVSNLSQIYREIQQFIVESCTIDSVSQKWLNVFSDIPTISTKNEVEHVLCVALHDVQGDLHDSITTPVLVFSDFVEFIHSKGFSLCSMKKYLESSYEVRKHLIVCTFDDGYANLATIVKPILEKYKFSATVFICTELIGKDNIWNNKDASLRKHLSLDEIKSLDYAGWEIASHGATHRNLLKLNDHEVDYELSTSKKFLNNLVGYSITYAYPYGANNKFIQQCVDKYYKYAFAVSQGGTSLIADRLQLKRYSISEIYHILK